MGTTRRVTGSEDRNGEDLLEKLAEASSRPGGTPRLTGPQEGIKETGGPLVQDTTETGPGETKQTGQGLPTILGSGLKPSGQSGSQGAYIRGGHSTGDGTRAGAVGVTGVPGAEPIYNPIGRSTVLEQYESTLGEKPERTEGERTTAAFDKMMGFEGTRPGPYESGYRAQMDEILGQLADREGFSYNPEEDQLYKNYRDQYLRLGNRAMQDTMAQAAGLTGGYGNSYATGAGQQAYQDYLSRLNERMPEMYQMAYERYKDQGDDLYNRLNALHGLDTTDYGRFRDAVGDWETDRDWWTRRYDTESGLDMDRYAQDLAAWQADRDYWKSMLSLMEDDRYALPTATGGGGGGGGAGGGDKKKTGDLSAEKEAAARLTLEEIAKEADKSKEHAPISEDVKKLYNGLTGTETVTVPVDTWTGADPGLAGLTAPVKATDTDVLDYMARLYGVSPSKLNEYLGK